jgi:hypothetical protein
MRNRRILNNFDTGKRKAAQHFQTENERRAAGESVVRTEAGTVVRTWGTAADMEGYDEAAAERKRAERSFATAAGHEGAVVLGPCGLREG